MRRSRIGLLLSAIILVIIGSLPGIALAQPTPSAPPGNGGPHEMLNGVLHGEGIVQTKKGPIRVAMQNGTATAASSSSLTIRSADGYTKTWTLAQNAKVYDSNHQAVQPGMLQAGSMVVVGGPITVNGGTASPAASPTTTYTAQIVMVQSTPSGTPTGGAS